jgi:uncharacterized membrane protein
VTVIGLLVLMSSNGARSGPGGQQTLIGGVLVGWGAFNVVEGVVDHHLLGIHHVRPGPDELLYDLGFLAWGAIMFVAGLALMRRASTDRQATTPTTR